MGKSTIILSAEDQTKAAFASVKKGLGDIESSIGKVKGVFSGFTAIAATAGITGLVKEAIAASSLAEQQSNRLNAVIRATGDTSGYTRGQLDKMAESLAKATTFDDDDIRGAQANLMKFGKLHGETFERALKLSADYAAFTGGSMVDATQAIGRALADPVNGTKALGQEFGKLTQAEQLAISTAMEHGRVADAQAVIFAKLEKSIGGTAGEMNTGIYGATTALTKSWDDMLKAFGKSGAVQVTTTGALTLIADGLDLVTAALTRQNNALKNNPLYSGQLQKLPQGPDVDPLKALQGSKLTIDDVKKMGPGVGRSLVPADKNSMTLEEGNAMGRSERAKFDADAAAKREGAAALEKQRIAEINKLNESRIQLMNLVIYCEDEWNKSVKESQKAGQAFEDQQLGFYVKDLEFAQQKENAGAESAQKNLEQYNKEAGDKALRMQQDFEQLQTSLFTDNEIRKFAYEEDNNLLNAALDKNLITHQAYYTLLGRLVVNNEKKNAQNIIAIDQQKNATVRAMQFQTAEMGINLLGLIVGKSKAGAIAVIALQKGLAIAQTIVSTSAAVMRALAELGPVVGAPVAASIKTLGAIQVGIIAATGIVEAGNVGSGGGGALPTFDANPYSGAPEMSSGSSGFDQVSPVQSQQKMQNVINLNVHFLGAGRYTQSEIIDGLGPALNEAIGDGFKLNVKTV